MEVESTYEPAQKDAFMTSVQEPWSTEYKTLISDSPMIAGHPSCSRGNQSHFDFMLDLDWDDKDSTNEYLFAGYTLRRPSKKAKAKSYYNGGTRNIRRKVLKKDSMGSMSSECERTFSSAGLTLTHCRNLMSDEIL